MKRNFIVEVISFLFILLFLYAALIKMLEYKKFTIQIGQSPLLTKFVDIVPWMVIGIELVISVALIIPRTRRVALFGSFSLMTSFTAYIVAILVFSPYVPCSCGGILEKMSWTTHLIFNVVFVALAVAAILLHQNRDAAETKDYPEVIRYS